MKKLKAGIWLDARVLQPEGELEAVMDLIQDSSCMSALTELFQRSNPIFKRRQVFMNMTPSRGG